MTKHVQKIDIALKHLKKKFPSLSFKAKQKTTSTKAKGWGIRVEREQTETTFEPIEDKTDEGK